MDADKIKIAVIDNHAVVRRGLTDFLNAVPAFEVVGTAADGAQLFSRSLASLSDILILDIDLPLMNGFQVLSKLKADGVAARIIFYTQLNNQELFQRAVALGAKGYILKSESLETLISAVKITAKGDMCFSPHINPVCEENRTDKNEALELLETLSARERLIIRCAAAGLNNRDIARMTGSRQKTVAKHRENIRKKIPARRYPDLLISLYMYREF